MDARVPILLLPLKIETRFIRNDDTGNDKLWIRVFPDQVFVENHRSVLNEQEREDAIWFKAFTDENAQKKGWKRLVKKYGAYRAAYLVHISSAEIDNQTPRPNNEDKIFYLKWLPERLHFYIYVEGKETLKVEGSDILFDDKDKIPILTDSDLPNSDWLMNFDSAVNVGLAVKVELPKPNGSYNKIDRIIVTGIRNSENPQQEIQNLFQNFQYSKDLSFVEYGTPTNNIEEQRSYHSVKDKYESEKSFEYNVKGFSKTTPDDYKSSPLAADVLSQALGLNFSDFNKVKNGDLQESKIYSCYQKATWFAMGGQTLQILCGDEISRKDHEKIWDYYGDYVKARGPYPSIKIGNQPYGILPVTAYRGVNSNSTKFQVDNKDTSFSKEMFKVFSSLFKAWVKMLKNENGEYVVPHAKLYQEVDGQKNNDYNNDIQEILPMQEYSVDYQLRMRNYDRISTRIPGWLQKEKNIPSPLPTVPPGMLYDILSDRPEANGKYDSIEKNVIDKLENIFGELPDWVKYNSPFVAIKDSEDITVKKIGDAVGDIVFKLVEDELETFEENILAKHKELFGSNWRGGFKPQLYSYFEDYSLFVDFLLRGYTNAIKLYYRVIYFEPSKEEVTSYEKFIVKIGGLKPKSIIITNGNKEFIIKSPFNDIVDEWFVEEGKEIQIGQRLFLARNSIRLKSLTKELYQLAQAVYDNLLNSKENIEKFKELQKVALRDAIDLNSYRLDAWLTSIATKRVEVVRERSNLKNLTYLGAYGWVENLSKDISNTVSSGSMTDSISKSDGGIIHCPSSNQALVATVFKNSFLTHHNEEKESVPNPFTLNLVSDRIQKSNQFMEGIRQDQSVEALLGYRLERYLHENELDAEIYPLRRAFPLEVNIINRGNDSPDVGFKSMSVIDGLKIIKAKNEISNIQEIHNSKIGIIEEGIEMLEDILDSSSDNLYFEAGYQLLTGNLDRSAAAMDASLGKIEPPETEGLKTKIPGVGVSHKLALVLGEANTYDTNSPKAFIEPNIESWLAEQLGEKNNIECSVEITGEFLEEDKVITFVVNLKEIGISFSDLLYLSETPVSDGVGELELRIWNYVKGKYDPNNSWEKPTFNITANIVATDKGDNKTLADALEWSKYTLALFGKCRPLTSKDFTMKGDKVREDIDSLTPIKERLNQLVIKIGRTSLEGIAYLSNFDLQEAKNAYLNKKPVNKPKLQGEIDAKTIEIDNLLNLDISSFSEGFETLKKISKILFGDAFILLPPANPSIGIERLNNEKKYRNSIAPSHKGQERVQVWVEELAQVNQGAMAFEEWDMVNSAWNSDKGNMGYEYQVYQGYTKRGTTLSYPWTALDTDEIKEIKTQHNFPGIDKAYPKGSHSLVLYVPNGIELEKSKSMYGIVIEEFSEHIPDDEMTTALSFHYNGPNSEPPQAFLLAVQNIHIGIRDAIWHPDDLANIINDTADLAKIRLMDLEALQDYGFILPMVDWFNIPKVN